MCSSSFSLTHNFSDAHLDNAASIHTHNWTLAFRVAELSWVNFIWKLNQPQTAQTICQWFCGTTTFTNIDVMVKWKWWYVHIFSGAWKQNLLYRGSLFSKCSEGLNLFILLIDINNAKGHYMLTYKTVQVTKFFSMAPKYNYLMCLQNKEL